MASIPSLEFRPPRLPKTYPSLMPVSALHRKRRRQLRIEKVGMQIESAGKHWGSGQMPSWAKWKGQEEGHAKLNLKDLKDRK